MIKLCVKQTDRPTHARRYFNLPNRPYLFVITTITLLKTDDSFIAKNKTDWHSEWCCRLMRRRHNMVQNLPKLTSQRQKHQL